MQSNGLIEVQSIDEYNEFAASLSCTPGDGREAVGATALAPIKRVAPPLAPTLDPAPAAVSPLAPSAPPSASAPVPAQLPLLRSHLADLEECS